MRHYSFPSIFLLSYIRAALNGNGVDKNALYNPLQVLSEKPYTNLLARAKRSKIRVVINKNCSVWTKRTAQLVVVFAILLVLYGSGCNTINPRLQDEYITPGLSRGIGTYKYIMSGYNLK